MFCIQALLPFVILTVLGLVSCLVCVGVYLLKVFSITLFYSQEDDYRPFVRGNISK